MTAEIVIMNKKAVALAADSAGTVTGPLGKKINNSQNKLFMLSKYEPIGIMVYNSSDFMGIPWETIIKEYRKELGDTNFDNLKEYVDGFFNFVEKKYSGTINEQKNYFRKLIRRRFKIIEQTVNLKDEKFTLKKFFEFLKKYDKEINQEGKEINELFPRFCIEQTYSDLKKIAKYYWNPLPSRFYDEVVKETEIIDEEIEKVKCEFSEEVIEYMRQIAVYSYFQDATGLVIVGFGREEQFPSIFSYTVGSTINNEIKKKLISNETQTIDTDNPAIIIPLAQHEMVDAFLYGVTPFFQHKSGKYLDKIFTEYPKEIIEIFEKIDKKDLDPESKKFVIGKLREIQDKKKGLVGQYHQSMDVVKNEYKVPIDATIINLPKDELALMAETMIHLTSLKRKVSMDEDETVGGAIDVAVISKGDGFVWIKRKHYFKPELNDHFFKNYF